MMRLWKDEILLLLILAVCAMAALVLYFFWPFLIKG